MIDAELLSIAYGLTNILPALHKGNLSIRLNHTRILQAIFAHNSVPAEKYNDIFAAILDHTEQKLSKFQLSSKVQAILNCRSKSQYGNLIETLLMELPLGGPRNFEECGASFRNILNGKGELSEIVRAAVEEINAVVSLAQSFGVNCPIIFCPGLSAGFELARDGGIIWQLVGNFKTKNEERLPSVLGIGGRYDYLLSTFQ